MAWNYRQQHTHTRNAVVWNYRQQHTHARNAVAWNYRQQHTQCSGMELPATVHSATVMCSKLLSGWSHISFIFHIYWSPGKPAYLFDERWGKYNDSRDSNYIRWPSVAGPVEWQITSLERILKHRNLCCLVSDHPASSILHTLYD